jgi:hypothetical protein
VEEKKIYKLNNPKLIQACLDEYEKNKSELKKNNMKEHDVLFLGSSEIGITDFWKKNLDLYDYVERNTYPRESPIWMSFLKVYKKDDYMGLHIDDDNGNQFRGLGKSTNSILIKKDDNDNGGAVVFAGKGWPPPRGESGELIIVNQNEPGDLVWWDNEQVHGITKINCGLRIALIIMKK